MFCSLASPLIFNCAATFGVGVDVIFNFGAVSFLFAGDADGGTSGVVLALFAGDCDSVILGEVLLLSAGSLVVSLTSLYS